MRVWFIYSLVDKAYLTVSVHGCNDRSFCNSYEASLETAYSCEAPQAFYSAETIHEFLSHDIGWFNSSIDRPQRGKYNLENTVLVAVELPIPVMS
jgi:hypothetical protein